MTTRAKTMRAREMRRTMTKQEVVLWTYLRNAQMSGFSFRRQHPVGPFFIDFYCPSAKLAIELDGGQHATEESRAYDDARTGFLARNGITVLRFWNHELKDNLEGVLEGIRRALPTTPTRPASPGDLPLSGGGLETRQQH
jgi:very-short-patch-repair endonuclease